MACDLGVSFFIPFHGLDPSEQSQCIYFTQRGARCRWPCQESDNKRAIALHETIIAKSSESIGLDLLQEYVLCNCCRRGRARHRDRIEDVGLLIPLARRWKDEIRRHAANESNHTTSDPALEESIPIPDAITTTATSSPTHSNQPNVRTSFDISVTPSKIVASSLSCDYSSPSSITTETVFQPSANKSRYHLRPREANIFTDSTSTEPAFVSQAPLSEFRPHVADPSSSDTVFRKIFDPLEGRDFESGSLYIFDRASSPGHVKIGWTARSVSDRLEDWSKCGYNPNLLFSVHCVRHAQRVETLTHHELIKEWRRERMCKALWCRKSHQEWFEIGKDRAVQVLGDWTDFMQKAEPYDSNGSLKTWWSEVIGMMDRNEEVVTAEKLLEHYRATSVKEVTLIENSVDLGHTAKVKKKIGCEYGLNGGHALIPKEELVRVSPPRIQKSTSPNNEASPKQIALVENFLLQAEAPSKRELVHTELLAPKTTPFKKELPSEQIPLSSSALLESRAFPQENLPSQETKSSPGTSETNNTVVDTLSSPNPSSELDLLGSSAKSASPRPTDEPQSNPPAEVLEALLSLSTVEQKESAETFASVTQRQQTVEEDGQAEPERELLRRDGQTREEKIQSHNHDESTIAEIEKGTRRDGWDLEETLVEDQIPRSMEKTSMKMAEVSINEIAIGKANGTAMQAVDIIAQA